MKRAQPKQDLLATCNDRGTPPAEFKGFFCSRCRNPGCINAGWGESLWTNRMSTQEDRLFNPTFADTDDPRFERFKGMDFPSMFHEAMRLEIADQRNDWEIPEIPILDGVSKVSEPETTATVEAAVQAMAGSQGKPTTPVVAPVPPPSSPPVRVEAVTPGTVQINTDAPTGGVMLDGSDVQPRKVEPKTDPWEVPKETKVAVGATVKIGGPKPK